jgi:hypothetical protein
MSIPAQTPDPIKTSADLLNNFGPPAQFQIKHMLPVLSPDID